MGWCRKCSWGLSLALGFVAANVWASPADPLLGPSVERYFQAQFGLSLDNVYWGDLHAHSYYSGDTLAHQAHPDNPDLVTPETVFQEARAKGFTFAAVTDHAEAPLPDRIPDDAPNVWESLRRMTIAAEDGVDDEDGIFVPMMGYEFTNPYPCVDLEPGDGVRECPGDCRDGDMTCASHGHKNVIFEGVQTAPVVRVSFLDPASWTTPEAQCPVPADAAPGSGANYCGYDQYTVWGYTNDGLWQWLRRNGYGSAAGRERASALTIIHSPGNEQATDWSTTDRDFVRAVEIFSQWGNSEGPPPSNCSNQSDVDVSLGGAESQNQDSLLVRPQLYERWIVEGDAAYQLGFVGGSDDHTGRPGGWGDGIGGVSGVIVPSPNRYSIFDAITRRRTLAATYYKSTGPLPVLFAVQAGPDHLLGGDIGVSSTTGTLGIRVWADPRIEEIQVVLDGCTIGTYPGSQQSILVTHVNPTKRHMVYVRARRATTEADNVDEDHPAATDWNQTWTSPVYLKARNLN